jgi:hypothetical protein
MPNDHSPSWFLRKHEKGDVFGPVSFDQIREWAANAYVNPQDFLSTDSKNWTKAPMIAQLQMDWLIEIPDQPLYGPTSAGAVLEFLRMGEITVSTRIVNCCTAETTIVSEAPFFGSETRSGKNESASAPSKSGIKVNLQKHVRDLEVELLEKRVELNTANQKIMMLEVRLHDLESRLKEKG